METKNPETIETIETETKKTETKKTRKRITERNADKRFTYISLTPGDRAYPADSTLLNTARLQYPFIFDFLSAETYNSAREIKLFISHNIIDPATNKKSRVQTFIVFAGTNKIKKFNKPQRLTFSIATAVNTFPSLKPLTALTDVTLYITVSAKTDFRFYVSFKN